MASGFDGLVERLLYDVALAGTGGEWSILSRAIEASIAIFSSMLTTLQV